MEQSAISSKLDHTILLSVSKGGVCGALTGMTGLTCHLCMVDRLGACQSGRDDHIASQGHGSATDVAQKAKS